MCVCMYVCVYVCMYACVRAYWKVNSFQYIKQHLTHDSPQTTDCEQLQIIIFLTVYTQSSVSEKQ
jgi:hypothetical protein